jgi:hypothetical protein
MRWRNETYHSTFGKTAAAKETIKVRYHDKSTRKHHYFLNTVASEQGFSKAREPWLPLEKDLAKTKADFNSLECICVCILL